MAKAQIQPLTFRKLADRESEERIPMLRVRAGDTEAVVVDDVDHLVLDPARLERILVNPATPGFDHEAWPLAGVELVGEAPKRTRVSTTYIAKGRSEGWIDVEGETIVHKPGGPDVEPWRVTHTFVHLDTVVFKLADGELRYRVTRQPDKYDGGPEAGTGKPTDVAADPETSVEWSYDLELEGGG